MVNVMISCDQHDYIEIACTFQYPLKVTLTSGIVFECVALDTQLNENREECIQVDMNGAESLVVLENISVLEVCVDNPHFHRVAFKE